MSEHARGIGVAVAVAVALALAVGVIATSSFQGQTQAQTSTVNPSGVTLGVSASPTVSMGQNETIYVSLTNQRATPNDASYTGLPILPQGPVLFSVAASVEVFPVPPLCGYPSLQTSPDYVPAYIVIYNGSGVPMQLTDSDIATLNCPHLTGTFRSFNASQTLTETLSIGAFWTGADASQPWENATYSPFSPGNYTIVAFDPWGQLAEFNFTVISGTASSTSTGTSSTVSTQNTTIITTAVDLGAAPNVQILNSSITAASSSTVTVLFNVSSSAQGTFYVTIATAGTQVLGLSFVQSWNPPPLPAGVSVSFGGLSVANGGTVTKGGDNATIQGVDHFLVPVTITLSDVPSGALKLEIIVFETQGSPPTSIGAIQTFQVTVS